MADTVYDRDYEPRYWEQLTCDHAASSSGGATAQDQYRQLKSRSYSQC